MQINDVWYLGIDFGTIALSAVLLNAKTEITYPIYWTTLQENTKEKYTAKNPTAAYSGMEAGNDLSQSSIASVVVGDRAIALAGDRTGLFIQKFKPFLNIAVPYYSPQTNKWEPELQWSDLQPVPVYWLRRSLQALLATLKPTRQESEKIHPALVKVGAVGLDEKTFSAAMEALQGVILGCPAAWGDTYRFNLREAVLGIRLVRQPEQIFFVEDAIATLLAELFNLGKESANKHSESSQIQNPKSLRGGTLVINSGATTTELAIVDLPEDIKDLTHSDFVLYSFTYGGFHLDQDIIFQLLLKDEAGVKDELIPPGSNFSWGDVKDFPLPGEPKKETRDRLQQLLQSSPLGLALLEAAQKLKQILQHQEEFTLDLGAQKCLCTRTELEERVFQPFIESLNQELNALLIQTKLSNQGINQVIYSGGTSALNQMQKWLRQKFPNAIFKSDELNSSSTQSSTKPSKVACGLAALPLYHQVLEQSQQQYSDYFLLLELLRTFPNQSLGIKEIMQLLERRGINTRSCHQRIIEILEGELPINLVPSSSQTNWLTQKSRQNLDYQGIAASPLFYKEGGQFYRPNPEQCQHLWRHLNTVLSGTYQKLEEPLSILDFRL